MVHKNPRASITIPLDLKDRLRDVAERAGVPMTYVLKVMVHRFERQEEIL